MDPSAWIALGFGGATLALNFAVMAVGYGVMKGTVGAMDKRIAALEVEIGALTDLRLQVAKIGERQDIWIDQLKELNASVRWMREPAQSEPIRGVTRPRPTK